MKRLLLALFPCTEDAERARAALGAAPAAARLHEGGLEPQLGIDLDGTPAQGADERGVAVRFFLAFAACTGAGVALDLMTGGSEAGLPLTMAFGSLGVLAGAVAVVLAPVRPLDVALTEASGAITRGDVLLSVAVDEASRALAAETVRRHGGRTVFAA